MVVEGDSVGEAVELQGRVLNGREGSPSVQSSETPSLLRSKLTTDFSSPRGKDLSACGSPRVIPTMMNLWLRKAGVLKFVFNLKWPYCGDPKLVIVFLVVICPAVKARSLLLGV